jgi:hypothetical protein
MNLAHYIKTLQLPGALFNPVSSKCNVICPHPLGFFWTLMSSPILSSSMFLDIAITEASISADTLIIDQLKLNLS